MFGAEARVSALFLFGVYTITSKNFGISTHTPVRV